MSRSADPTPSGRSGPEQTVPPRFRLARMIASVWVPQALHAAAKLGVADALAGGARPAPEVADAVGADPDATHRLLRALVVLELLTQDEDGRFALTDLGRCLTADAPDSVRSWALLWGGPMMWAPWGRLADCVRTGETGPGLLEGFRDPFELMEAHPEDRDHFDRSMLQLTRGVAAALPAAWDFDGVESVVDVGGGLGALLPPLLRAHPGMRGTVFDLPHCAEGARALLAAEGLADRCAFVGGDFFEAVPAGADVYLLKSVIHDWDDARARRILTRCREAMRPDSRLLVLEWIVPERVGPQDAGIVGTD
ncbi:MAG: methyltransferase, partial [Myxococcota bacterium]|nr:methyltransferase [Myxococcota bacterium]